MTKTYRIPRISGAPDWSAIPAMTLDECPWGRVYCPELTAQLAFDPEKGFWVRMTCREEDPRAVYTQGDDPVCQDSCMEAFIDFDPSDAPDARGYLNLEANARGTYLLGLGRERHGRVRVRALGCALPQLEAICGEGWWGWQALLPLEMLGAIYGRTAFAPGALLRGNFYKCGDATETPHYCVWNSIAAPQPDYHRPECFGELIVD